MGKTTETIHCRVDTFSLSAREITAALRLKYGNDPAFDDGEMTRMHLEKLLPDVEGYGDTTIEFTTVLS
ncbi:hypothetical protein [Pseudomonas sp. p106]|uniref:hypothetical protein n=1 Tax=Pseudomonas sp. p106 TaxID=2479854 RepID=UPI000F7B89BD|nr:hypothetical protein [Pseudomonas sp. p106]RRV49587.1 hypothetical protein EGJ09_01230 [Pseudomonas sp. p106]